MLAIAVVIAGDRAGADVHALADPGIAEVAEMIRLGALTQLGFFHLDEIADLGRATDHRPRSQVGERPYRRVVFETSLPNHATVLDHHSMTEDAVGNPGMGTDLAILADCRASFERDMRGEDGVLPDFHVCVDGPGRRIPQGHTVLHRASAQLPPH